MDQNVVGSIVGAAVQVVLQNLISLCAEEIKLFKNFKEDLEKLKDSFRMVQAFLNDAQKQQLTGEAVKIWLESLEAVAFDADNVIDELNYEVLREKAETGKKLLRAPAFVSTGKWARKIRKINEKLKSINQQATDFGLQIHVATQHAPSVRIDKLAERETDSYSVDPIVVGREDYVSGIVELLTSNNSTHGDQEVFSVLPIVGMGGLGKTTTAKLVFQDEKMKRHFDKLIWVFVSEKFDANDLFKKILQSLTEQKVDLDNKDVLLGKIQKILENKKYLLVLDDVWTDETTKWGDFQNALSSISSVKGNGIVVTTRSEDVASMVGTIDNIPKLGKLSDEDCWSIIKGKAFRRRSVIPTEFEPIGRKIAERCQGLPLVANVLGGMLYGKPKEVWHSIEEKRLSDLGEDGKSVEKILKLSFDNLPSQSLKKCFAFCSMFPKGFEIEKDMLIYLWMAEGFLGSDQGNDMEAVGQKYIHLLIQNSLLQNWWPGCKMHDLVHDLASSISRESGPVRFMYMDSDRHISKEKAANLRSLIIKGKCSENMFADLKCLRGLVLIDYGNKELPKMEHLLHLRYLDISNTEVEHLPRSIDNFYHLQTLRASKHLNEIPKTLKKLIKLRHLHILGQFWNSHESNIEELPMLGHLPHLKSLHLYSLPNLRSIGALSDGIHEESIGKNKTIVFPALKSLSLEGMSSMTELLTMGESQPDRDVVEFPHLESLKLHSCKELSSGPSHFPCLKELEIKRMSMSVFLENLLLKLTSLTRIKIWYVDGLVCLPDMFFCNNQNLSYLQIRACNNLKYLPSFLPNNLHCLNSLEMLQIDNCPNLESIPYNQGDNGHEPVEGFTLLRELKISGCASLTELPSGMIELCTSLETVSFWELPSVTNLGAVVGCLKRMPHLATLDLDLRYIPKLELGSLRSLRELTISCGMENWEGVQDQLHHLTNLRGLWLRDLEIEALTEWLGNLSSLRELFLCNCPKLRSLPSKEAMKRLTRLWIYECPLLNVRSDDDNSEWHKISHIPFVYV